MIDRDEALRMKLRLRALTSPVLSLYLRVHPGPEQQRGHVLRARAAVEPLGAPDAIVREVLRVVDADRRAGTLAVFASASELEVIPFSAVLPLGDLASGEVEVHWGEPYLAPVLLALEGRPRHAVIHLDDRFVRLFEVFLDEIELRVAFSRSPDAESSSARGVTSPRRSEPGGRDASVRERGERQRDEWRHGFYREVGRQLRSTLAKRDIDSIILVGPDRDIYDFLAVVPQEMSRRNIVRLPALSRPDAGPAQVLAHAAEAVRAAEERCRDELLDRAREHGVCGARAALQALREGRLATLLVAWNLDHGLRSSLATERSRWQLADEPAATADAVEPRLTLPALARRYSTEIVFVDGAPGSRLRDELGGVAGLTRW